jgi:hypothetical protein
MQKPAQRCCKKICLLSLGIPFKSFKKGETFKGEWHKTSIGVKVVLSENTCAAHRMWEVPRAHGCAGADRPAFGQSAEGGPSCIHAMQAAFAAHAS